MIYREKHGDYDVSMCGHTGIVGVRIGSNWAELNWDNSISDYTLFDEDEARHNFSDDNEAYKHLAFGFARTSRSLWNEKHRLTSIIRDLILDNPNFELKTAFEKDRERFNKIKDWV